MECRKCKKEIPEGSKFCNHCGTKQERAKKMRKDGRYQKQITITVNGMKKQKCFYGKTMADVNKKILAYHEEQANGRLFSIVADEWWEKHEETLAYSTRRGYNCAVRTAKEELGDTPITKIRTVDISNYIDKLAAQGYARQTLSVKLQVIRQTLSYAIRIGELETNSADYVQLPRGLPKTERRAPTADEIKIIKNSVDVPFGLFAFFCYYTGCRRGEALAIQGKDIDLENDVIHITKSIDYNGNSPIIKGTKTKSGVRAIPLLPALKEKLPPLKPNEYLFGGAKPLSNGKYDEYWHKYAKTVGIEITAHQLRHGYASRLYELGIDDKSAQNLMGHSNIAVTKNVYTHVSEGHQKVIAQQLSGF